MNKRFKFSALILVAFASHALSSPPVEDRIATFDQSDGSKVTLMRYGDARFHWLETRAGEVVVRNPDTGDYEYAKIRQENGRPMLVPSGIRADQDQKKNLPANERGGESFTPLTRKDLIRLRKAANKKNKPPKPVDNTR